MPILFNDYLKPRSDSSALLLEDDIKGGFKSVAKLEDLGKIKTAAIKKGMLVYVVETKIVYECLDLTYEYNDDGDEIIRAAWDKFVVPVASNPDTPNETPTNYRRPQKVKFFVYTSRLGCKYPSEHGM